MKIYDNIILIIAGVSISWTAYEWLKLMNHPQQFNVIGAIFAITMASLVIKAFIDLSIIGYTVLTPIIQDKFNFKLPKLNVIKIFNKRIEFSIRVIDKDGSKVTF